MEAIYYTFGTANPTRSVYPVHNGQIEYKTPLEINSSQLNDYYLAGFFDAEGCIMIRKTKNGDLTKGVSIKITQKNETVSIPKIDVIQSDTTISMTNKQGIKFKVENLDEISKERNLWVGKLNVDENLVKSAEFAVSSIPTMVLFKGGVPVKTLVGAKPKHKLIEELKEWI